MYPVSQKYHEEMRADRRRVFARCQIDYTSPFLDQSIEVMPSETARYSYPEHTADNLTEPYAKFASLDGSCKADGTCYPAPGPEEAKYMQMGWWGEKLAGAGGAFTSPYPTLTVMFFSRPIDSLKVVGDSKREEWPVDFEIKLHDETDDVLYTETVTGNTEITWSKPLGATVTQVVKMTLEITRWSHVGRQVKILEFFSSLQETYENEDIILLSLLEEQEVSYGSLPVGNISSNEIEIKLYNRDRRFDVGNTNSPLYGLLKPNRRIRPELGAAGGGWHTELEQLYSDMSRYLMVGHGLARSFTAGGTLGGMTEVRISVLGVERFFMPPDTITFHIYNDNDGEPGSSLGHTITQGTDWPEGATPEWFIVDITLNEALAQGVRYWIVLIASSSGPPSGYIKTRVSTTTTIPGERFMTYDFSSPNPRWDPLPGSLTFRLEAPSREYVPLGVFWTGDWSIPDDGLFAQTTARDRLELLRHSTYEPGSDFADIDNLHDLAVDILQKAGLTNTEYWIDPGLEHFRTAYAYIPPQSHREALRLVAEACAGRVYCDREGVVRVEGPSFIKTEIDTIKNAHFVQGGTFPAEVETVEGAYAVSVDDYFSKDIPIKQGEMANHIEVETQFLASSGIEEEVYRSSEPVQIEANQEIAINALYRVAPCIGAAASLENADPGIEIVKEEHYPDKAEIVVHSTVEGEFELAISAAPLKVLGGDLVVLQDQTSISQHGLVKFTFPRNPLVQLVSAAEMAAGHILALYKEPRQNVELDWRGNPALELGDIIQVPVYQRSGIDRRSYFIVTRQELEYDGGLRARLSGYRITE